MQVLYTRCCGLDVHKETVVACRLLTCPNGRLDKQLRTFSTMTRGLLELKQWLQEEQVSHVAMEATGVFWWPIFNVLEGQVEMLVVNAHHAKQVPGRKTDAKDSEWLADLLRHGLLQASFIPPKAIRELRDLMRARSNLVQERSRQINRVQKVLETANIKLAAVVTDILGKSSRQMIEALLDGQTDPTALARLARSRLRTKIPQLSLALEGHLDDHHILLLRQLLAQIDFLTAQMLSLEQAVEARLPPFQESLNLLITIPAISRTSAIIILSEIGENMSLFPSAAHLASWAGVCPGNAISAGKRKSGKPTKGNKALRAVLCEIAWVISHMRGNYLSAQYRRLQRRLGPKQAALAVAHSVLVIIYHVLRDREPYHDLGADYFHQLDQERLVHRSVRQLQALGYEVALTSKEEVNA
jgi:transposase